MCFYHYQSFDGLDNYMEKITDQDILISTGVGCREQILDIFGSQSQHLPQIFIKSIEAGSC